MMFTEQKVSIFHIVEQSPKNYFFKKITFPQGISIHDQDLPWKICFTKELFESNLLRIFFGGRKEQNM